jgi:HK97 family phage portal protein
MLLNKAPVPYVARGSSPTFLRFGGSDSERMMQQYGSVGTLFMIVNRLANSVSQVDWHLYRKRTDQRRRYGPVEDNRVEVTSHLALDIWNKPNDFYTRQEFVESFQQHLDLTGEGWWVVGRGELANLPLELWCVRPDKMKPIPDAKNFLSGYEYRGPNGEQVPLGLDEVVQLRMPNPLDPYRGLGPVQAILTDLDSTRYTAEWNRNFFFNDATPGGVVEVVEHLSDPEFDELSLRWREQHQGVRNAHRVAVLDNNAKWKDVSYSMKDMQFAQLRDQSREQIMEAFGFPKAMSGRVDDVNRANAEANEVVYARWLLVPRLERIKGALNRDFLPLFGADPGLEFDYDNPVPEDKDYDLKELDAKVDRALKLIEKGVDPTEAFEFCGLPDFTFAPMSMPAPAPNGGTPQPAPVGGASNGAGNGHGWVTPELVKELQDALLGEAR